MGACLAAFLLALGTGARPHAQAPRDARVEHLRILIASSQEKSGWPALRHFAESAADPDQKDQAYFALGYLEYEASEFGSASDDLKRAAETQFSLTDCAEYYGAAAAFEGKQPQTAVDILDGFIFRHPQSVLRFDALALFAQALIQTGQPGRAIQTLMAEPQTRQRPPLELLLARAYQGAGKFDPAARSFQNVYYTFPTSSQARAAGEALDALRAQLGAERFPSASEELETVRAETLFNHSRIAEALKEFGMLLKENPSSAFAPRWKVGRARCLLHLRQTTEALDQLQINFPKSPSADADRLEALVEAYVQHDNKVAMDLILDQLRTLYPHSPSYAAALDAAGNHLVRQGDWQGSARYYQSLGEWFPETPIGQEANWRVAWSYYLQKENAKARQAFVGHAMRYPTSPHVAANFYWLGRLAENEGATSEARSFYGLVQSRWAQSYYAFAARRRLVALPRSPAATDRVELQTRSMADDLAQKVPPPRPPADSCPPAQPLPALRSFSMLESLGLDDLATQNLKALVRERPVSPALFIAKSRFEAEKDNYNPSVIDAGKAVPLFADYELSDMPRETWTLLYPTVYWTLVEDESRERGLDPYLVMGLIRQESAFDPHALSKANARGLMQILRSTARTQQSGRGATAQRLYDPAYNVTVGSEYLKHLLELNQGVPEQAMAAYHAGEGRVSSWLSQHAFSEPAEFLESIPIPATRAYVEKVVRDSAIYRRLMTGAPVFKKCG
jgi:soluble lytic murein transglycosylase